jgi:hypothetical protein
MKSNLKVILAAAGVAALLASPAMAKSHTRSHDVARALAHVPADTRGAVDSYAPAPATSAQHVYAPELPVAPQLRLLNPDFQLGGNHD